ncbi:hypothetical protein BJY52DRAFT_453540 [Lactarius psammicola]|nr:hypothetical protein BJY52DRAFT_453540 [Lactarius psammicola]
MSSSVPPTQLLQQSLSSGLTQSQASLLGPGIVGLFIQGIETGLVFAQFSRWFFRPDRSGSSILSAVVIFVTVVGLAQTGICFSSVWGKYVQRFGMPIRPDWEDIVQSIPTYIISFPVQALMIRRCYWLGRKNMAIVTPLALLLVASIVMTSWSIFLMVHYLTSFADKDWARLPQTVGILWPYLMSLLLPSVLDFALTGILLHYLTRTMKQVYAPHKRKRITRLVNIVWQSALPPTVCAICALVMYLIFSTSLHMVVQFWFPVVQAMIGKLYVLSLFYMINAQPIQPDEGPTTIVSTLTVPAEVMLALTRNARVGDVARGEIAAECGPARTLDSAV